MSAIKQKTCVICGDSDLRGGEHVIVSIEGNVVNLEFCSECKASAKRPRNMATGTGRTVLQWLVEAGVEIIKSVSIC